MERHFAVHERPLTFEELVEMSRRNPREVVQMVRGEMMFQQQGEFEFSKSPSKVLYINGKKLGLRLRDLVSQQPVAAGASSRNLQDLPFSAAVQGGPAGCIRGFVFIFLSIPINPLWQSGG